MNHEKKEERKKERKKERKENKLCLRSSESFQPLRPCRGNLAIFDQTLALKKQDD